jgi:inositol transport system substrate-binding protein
MKRVLSFLVIALMAVSGLFAAGGQQSGGTGKIRIAFARSESNDTWLSYLHDAFAAEFANKPEYEILWSDGQNDVTRQQDNVNAAISQGVKAIVVVPIDTGAVTPIVRAAQEAKIPLVFAAAFSTVKLQRRVYGG